MPKQPDPNEYQPRQGVTYKLEIQGVVDGDPPLFLTVNHDENGQVFEIFARYDAPEYHELIVVITRMVSMALREGVPPDVVARELQEIHSPVSRHLLPRSITECPSLTARIGAKIEEHLKS